MTRKALLTSRYEMQWAFGAFMHLPYSENASDQYYMKDVNRGNDDSYAI